MLLPLRPVERVVGIVARLGHKHDVRVLAFRMLQGAEVDASVCFLCDLVWVVAEERRAGDVLEVCIFEDAETHGVPYFEPRYLEEKVERGAIVGACTFPHMFGLRYSSGVGIGSGANARASLLAPTIPEEHIFLLRDLSLDPSPRRARIGWSTSHPTGVRDLRCEKHGSTERFLPGNSHMTVRAIVQECNALMDSQWRR